MSSNTYKRSKAEIDEMINNLQSKNGYVDGFLSLVKLTNLLLDLDEIDTFIDVAGKDIKSALSKYFPHCKELDADDFRVVRLILKDYKLTDYLKKNQAFLASAPVIALGTYLAASVIPNPWFKVTGIAVMSVAAISLLKSLYISLVQLNYRRKVSIRKAARKKKKQESTGKRYYNTHGAEPCFS